MNKLPDASHRTPRIAGVMMVLLSAFLTFGVVNMVGPPSVAASAAGGTFICQHIRGDGKTIVDISQVMSPGTNGSIAAMPPTLTAADETCSLSGTIPRGWSITDAPFPLTLQNGSANDGTLRVMNWFNSFEQGNYPATVFGLKFTNRGRFIEANDPQGAATVPISVQNFINARGGTVQTSPEGELDFIDPSLTVRGSLDNRGVVSNGAGSVIRMQGQAGNNCRAGDALVLENGSKLNNRGTLQLECGGLVVNGGQVVGTQPVTMFPDNTETITFASSAPSVKPGISRSIYLASNGAVLSGSVPKGWSINLADARVLGVANRSGNRGTIHLGPNDSIQGPGATFTNSGRIEAAGKTNTSALISVADFVNHRQGVVSATKGEQVNFSYRTSSEATTGAIENFGTMVLSGGGSFDIGDGYCPLGNSYDGERLTLEVGGKITGSGSTVMQCGTFFVKGGAIGSATPLTVEPSAVTLRFGPRVAAGPGHGANTINLIGGNATAVLAGTLPHGWTIHVVGGDLGAANGAANAGIIDISASYRGIVDQGRFTNKGTILVGPSVVGQFVAKTFNNSGLLKVDDGGAAYFSGPSGAPTHASNGGTLWVSTQAAVQLRSAGSLVDRPGSTTRIDVNSAPAGTVIFSETGTMTLGGTFHLVTSPGFRPAKATQYQLVQVLGSAILNGSPSKVQGLNAGHGLTYQVKQTAGALTATVS